jgi:hypothetical protein
MALCIPPCLWDAVARRVLDDPCCECGATLRSYTLFTTRVQLGAIFFAGSFAVLAYWFFAYDSPHVLWKVLVGVALYRGARATAFSHHVPMMCAGYYQFGCLLNTINSGKKVVWIATSPEHILAYSRTFSCENVPRRLPDNMW